MPAPSSFDDIRSRLQGLGITAPDEDLPFLQRAFTRQQELLARTDLAVPKQTPPAHVFTPPVP